MASVPDGSAAHEDLPRTDDEPRGDKDASTMADSPAPAMTSQEMETILLDSMAQPSASVNDEQRPPPLSRRSTAGIKKCWICVGDSTEDDSTNPPAWRAPCKCSLTAHEACLLDWIADLENPRNQSRRRAPDKIECPQCKSEIKIARPRSYVVEGVKAADRAFNRLVVPGLGVGLLSTIFAGSWVHGFQSVYIIFGGDDAQEIWRYAERRPGTLSAYCLVPLNLIFARTRYSDFVLPSGTLFLLATQLDDGFEIDWTMWPPRASTIFACLPAIRSLYNWSYEKAFGKLNKKWLKEVQPRREDPYEGQEQNIADIMQEQEGEAEAEANADGVVFELEVNLGGNDEDEDAAPAFPDHVAAEAPDVPNHNVPAGGEQENGNNENGNVNPRQQQQQQDQAHVHRILGERGEDLMEGTSSLGQLVLGALMFPSIAASMGGLLKVALPPAWTSPGPYSINGRPGLLGTRWGRSVVGGALFVVLKDAIVLYYRYKMAQSHRHRKIMNFDKQTKQYSLE